MKIQNLKSLSSLQLRLPKVSLSSNPLREVPWKDLLGQRETLMFVGVVISVIYAAHMYIVTPAEKTLRDLLNDKARIQEDIKNLSQFSELAQAQSQIDTITIISEIESLEGKIKNMMLQFLQITRLSPLLQKVTQLSPGLDFRFSAVEHDPDNRSEGLEYEAIKVRGEGSFVGLLQYLKHLDELRGTIVINELEIDTDQELRPSVRTNLEVAIYKNPPIEVSGSKLTPKSEMSL